MALEILRHLLHTKGGPIQIHIQHTAEVTFVIATFIFSMLVDCVAAQSDAIVHTPSKLLDSLMHNLNRDTNVNKVPPTFDFNTPTYVKCQIYVDTFDTISESSMDYTASLMLSLSWSEPKLQYDGNLGFINFMQKNGLEFLEVDYDNMKNIWIPELYFPNEKKARFHDVMNPNQMIRVYPDGTLDYFARLSLTLSCPMNLRNYPFDKQECSIKIESFAYDNSKLRLDWSTHPNTPVGVSKDIELPQFQVTNYEWKRCSHNELSRSVGNYSCLEAVFHLERSLQFFLIQMYIPSTLIVIVSWLSFWLNADSVPGRVSLGVLTVLTMTTQSSSVNASLPRVSYLKAIDLWMSTCLVFVFAALSEFAVVNFLSRHDFNPRKRPPQGPEVREPALVLPTPSPAPSPPTTPADKENILAESSLGGMQSTDTIGWASSQEVNLEQGMLLKETLVGIDGQAELFRPCGSVVEKSEPTPFCCTARLAAAMVDRISRVIFPFAFATFCACYWTYYAHFTESSLSIMALESGPDVNSTDAE